MSDQDLSKKANVPVHVVSYRRKQLGIAAYSVFEKVKPFRHLLGSHSDKYVAVVAHTTPQVVGRYRRSLGVDKHAPQGLCLAGLPDQPVTPVAVLLGRVHDDDLANLVNVPLSVIEDLRIELNIEQFATHPGNLECKRRSAIYRFEHLLLAPDIPNWLLANLAGVSQQRVSVIRRQHREKASRKVEPCGGALLACPVPLYFPRTP